MYFSASNSLRKIELLPNVISNAIARIIDIVIHINLTPQHSNGYDRLV
ncbi:hypothetical protein [Staphylococcus hominis]|nr:hypothetical protein [Staphylococcus hominis]MEB5793349.1 hypothetical protein [Staphylococcus hominis]MEB5793902.1 hypothetical protein [Staphylococcus hominis]